MRLAAAILIALSLAPFVRAADPPSTSASDKDTVVVDTNTEQAIKGALKYLASQQQPNGSWTVGQHPAAITGYVLMAFLATGNLPDEGEYGKNVTKGMQYLLASTKPDGFIQGDAGGNMYGHGIATIALGELYGQTHDQRIRPKLELAVKLIVNCQNDQGGWRYAPRKADADLSVTVLQVVALRAAKNAGLDVPQSTLDKAVSYVRSCYNQPTGGFCYQPGQQPGFARTAAAIYSLQVCGQYEDPKVKAGSAYLFQKKAAGEYYTYGNFYAAPAQYMIGGDTWAKWYAHINSVLVPKIQPALTTPGDIPRHWDPIDGQVGAVWATAVYTTILAMPYHYVPLYQR